MGHIEAELGYLGRHAALSPEDVVVGEIVEDVVEEVPRDPRLEMLGSLQALRKAGDVGGTARLNDQGVGYVADRINRLAHVVVEHGMTDHLHGGVGAEVSVTPPSPVRYMGRVA